MTRASDLVGKRFGRLMTIKRGNSNKWGRSVFICECDCGAVKSIYGEHLSRGLVKSCGCFRVDFGREIGLTNSTHMMTNTPEYRAWANMKDRCYNSGNKLFRRYGGRGIRVSTRWLDSFESFFADMGKRPSPDHSIDRWPDNNGDYEKDNCRWATRSQQQRNKNSFKHKKSRSGLTEWQRKEIRAEPWYSGSGVYLAKKYGVSDSVISRIRHGLL